MGCGGFGWFGIATYASTGMNIQIQRRNGNALNTITNTAGITNETPRKRRMRYNARKVEIDGIKFDSIHESQVYADLKLLQRSGAISKLQVHPQFVFIVNGVVVGKYTPDFAYHDSADRVHIVDAKGFKKGKRGLLPRVDRDFNLRRKLMKACFALDVEIL